jgi:ABC-2 type transport system permease protein
VVETRGRDELPEDCDAVLVVGPESAFSSEEAGMLRDHVRRGGNLMVALDPQLDRSDVRSSGLEEVLRDLGVRVDRTVVLELDGSRLAPDRPSPAGPFLIATYGDHPITTAFAATGIPMVVNLVRSVRLVDEDRGTVLLSTSDASFAEVDVAALIETAEPHRDDEDIAGPVPVAVALEVERLGDEEDGGDAEDDTAEDDADAEDADEAEADAGEDARGRLVVIGDSDFLESSFMSAQDVVNYEVTSAILGWLTQRQALIAIPPRRVNATAVRMTEDDVADLGFRVMVLMPLASVFLGIAVWWSRRS